MKAVRRFFEEGDKVKVTLPLSRSRNGPSDLGFFRLLERVKVETGAIAKVEAEPSMEGRPNGDGARAEIGAIAPSSAHNRY